MVKVLENKGTREATVGYRTVNLTTYSLGVNAAHCVTPEEARRDVCKLCYLGDNKARGRYNSLEEMRKCNNCATDINKEHAKAKEKGEKFVVEIEALKTISSDLTAFGKTCDQPTIKGLEDF